MKASIIIASFNRPELLSYGLHTLALQNFSRDEVEVIVLNDGDPNDGTDGVCELFDEDLNIRYYSANNRCQWRTPGFALNFGVKQSLGRFIFLSCAEIYHIGNSVEEMLEVLEKSPRSMVIPSKGYDDDGTFLNKLNDDRIINPSDYMCLPELKNIHFPFFMGISKDEFMKIGGYDEEFTGIGFDDNDIVSRLKKNGLRYSKVSSKIIHMYHKRLAFGQPEVQRLLKYNSNLFNKKKNIIVRNKNKNWGTSF